MAPRARSRPEARRIVLSGDLRIAAAREAYEAITAGAGDLEIDGSQVARIDAAGLQAIAAGIARRRGQGTRCSWQGVSETLAGAAALAGLARALGLAEASGTGE